LLMVLNLFAKEDLDDNVKFELSDLADKLGFDAEEFQGKLDKMLKKKESFALMVGEDLYNHPKAANIAKLVALIEKNCDIKVAMIPPKSNALGVALICDLDDETEGSVVGYNELGDFEISALGCKDFDIPAMNQQEGTITNMNKRVVVLNAALAYNGYTLNDIMNELGFSNKYTINWTSKLPIEKGYQVANFDDLPNEFGNDWSENRGYVVANIPAEAKEIELDDFEAEGMEGDIAYRCNPQRQFNDFTDKAHQIFEEFALYASAAKAEELGDKVAIKFDDKGGLELPVVVDERIEGDIVEVPDFKADLDVYSLFGDNRYAKVTIEKV